MARVVLISVAESRLGNLIDKLVGVRYCTQEYWLHAGKGDRDNQGQDSRPLHCWLVCAEMVLGV